VTFAEVPAWVQTIMFRADALEGLGFREARPGTSDRQFDFCEDMHFCLLVYRRGSVGFIDEPLVHVRRHGNNITKSPSEMPQAKLAALQLLGDDELDFRQRQALRRRLARAQIEVGLQYVENGQIADAFRAYLRALAAPGARLSALKNIVLLPHHSLRGRAELRQPA
jgi:hypothetical protein